MREQNPNPASQLKALIELFDREWHRFSFPAFGFWRDRGWNGTGAGFELNFYSRGENTVIQDKRSLSCRQGDLIVVSDTVAHSFCRDGSFDLYYLMFQFDRPDLNARMRELCEGSEITRAPLSMPGLQADFRALFTQLRMERQISVIAKHHFLHIFVKIFMDRMQSTGNGNKYEQIVRQVIEDVQEHLDGGAKLRLPEVAARYSLNERYLNQIFKTVTGTTLGQYILSNRIEAAKRLLETTSIPITEIAMVTGFYDGAHFSKMFKASETMTPQAYRDQHAMQIHPD